MTVRPYRETVLVVDDTEFMVKVLEDVFGAPGYRVLSATSGAQALDLYREHLPDLVTLDLVMPGMDGLAVLQALRGMDPACRVIMVSAVGLEAKVVEALQMGAKNYVLKPVDREKILVIARKLLDEY